MHLKLAAAILTILFAPVLAHAASFDCATPSTKIEAEICGEPTLSSADDEMAALYLRVKAVDPQVVSDQREWIENKRNLCQTPECIAQAYLDRISYFEGRLNDVREISPVAPVDHHPAANETAPDQRIPKTSDPNASETTSATPETEVGFDWSALSFNRHPVVWAGAILFVLYLLFRGGGGSSSYEPNPSQNASAGREPRPQGGFGASGAPPAQFVCKFCGDQTASPSMAGSSCNSSPHKVHQWISQKDSYVCAFCGQSTLSPGITSSWCTRSPHKHHEWG